MIKILLLISIFCASGYLGINFGRAYLDKERFYTDFLDFCRYIKSEISFLKTNVLSLLNNCSYKSNFNDLKNNMTKLIIANQRIDRIELQNILESFAELDERDKQLILHLFLNLGQLGYDEQIENIFFCEAEIEKLLETYKNKTNKMVPLCNKMGFLIGLLVCIVLI